MAEEVVCKIDPPAKAKGKTSFDEVNKATGRFERTATTFRKWVKADNSTEFPPEAGRYHLYVCYACPWASRCLAFRALKGLQDAIPVHTVHPTWGINDEVHGTSGWVFSDTPFDGIECNDPVYNCKHLKALYEIAVPDYSGRYTVPVLWDTKTKTIVNNESSEIIQMFNTEFNALAKRPEVNLRPAELLDEINRLNDWMYNSINNGVYRCGFATTQAAYEEAFHQLFKTLDEAEEILSKKRYLTGKTFTEADIRLFVTLIRFDLVYVGHFKCNKKRIQDYPSLWGYVRELYQMPGVHETVNLAHIKTHYYSSHPKVNPTLIVPLGPDIDFTIPHGRDQL